MVIETANQRRRSRLLAAGLCIKCAEREPIVGKKRCSPCIKKQSDYNKNYRESKAIEEAKKTHKDAPIFKGPVSTGFEM